MNSIPKIGKKAMLLLIAVGIILYISFLLVLNINIGKVISLISRARIEYVTLALLFDTSFILFYAFAWYFIVRIFIPDLRLRDSLLAVIMGWLGDMIIPAAFITGEIIRLYYIGKKYKSKYGTLATTIVIHRLLSVIAFVFFIFTGAILLTFQQVVVASNIFREMILFAILSIVAVLLIVYVIFVPERLNKTLIIAAKYVSKALAKMGLSKYSYDILSGFKSFHESIIQARSNMKPIAVSLLLLLIQWVFGILVPYNIFKALGHDVSFWLLSLAYPLYGVADNIPIGIPVNAGVLDTAMITTFILLGIDKNLAVSATVLTRFITVCYEAFLTGVISLLFGIREILYELEKEKREI